MRVSLDDGRECRDSIGHCTLLEDVQVELAILVLLELLIVLCFFVLHEFFCDFVDLRVVADVVLDLKEFGIRQGLGLFSRF